MTNMKIEVAGLDKLIRRMRRFPRVLSKMMRAAMVTALTTLWEHVPAYPRYQSSYIRTGTLGRSLGVSMSGQKLGVKPDIFEARPVGSGGYRGEFGTTLKYAPYVIGDFTQAAHMGHWWTLRTVAKRARRKIEGAFEKLGKGIARFLEGRGGP